jgi:hypothetical protein
MAFLFTADRIPHAAAEAATQLAEAAEGAQEAKGRE